VDHAKGLSSVLQRLADKQALSPEEAIVKLEVTTVEQLALKLHRFSSNHTPRLHFETARSSSLLRTATLTYTFYIDSNFWRLYEELCRIRVELELSGNSLWILTPGERYKLREFRSDMGPSSLFSELIKAQGSSPLNVATLKRRYLDLARKDLGEVIRSCGFDQEAKRLFFRVLTTRQIQLNDPILLTESNFERFITKAIRN
jgi:hypothetical protein